MVFLVERYLARSSVGPSSGAVSLHTWRTQLRAACGQRRAWNTPARGGRATLPKRLTAASPWPARTQSTTRRSRGCCPPCCTCPEEAARWSSQRAMCTSGIPTSYKKYTYDTSYIPTSRMACAAMQHWRGHERINGPERKARRPPAPPPAAAPHHGHARAVKLKDVKLHGRTALCGREGHLQLARPGDHKVGGLVLVAEGVAARGAHIGQGAEVIGQVIGQVIGHRAGHWAGRRGHETRPEGRAAVGRTGAQLVWRGSSRVCLRPARSVQGVQGAHRPTTMGLVQPGTRRGMLEMTMGSRNTWRWRRQGGKLCNAKMLQGQMAGAALCRLTTSLPDWLAASAATAAVVGARGGRELLVLAIARWRWAGVGADAVAAAAWSAHLSQMVTARPSGLPHSRHWPAATS
jgi:hypothetical protein